NFTSFRYSLPVLFSFYIFILELYTAFISKHNNEESPLKTIRFLWLYLMLSLVFLVFFDFSHMEVGNRFNGFTGSPTTYAAIMTIIYLLVDYEMKNNFSRRILLFLIIFLMVYLSKT